MRLLAKVTVLSQTCRTFTERVTCFFFVILLISSAVGGGGVWTLKGGGGVKDDVSNDFGEIVFSERPVLLQWLHRVGCLIGGDQVDQSTEDMRSYAGRNTMACSERNVSPET